ncbi:DUF6084 family protein [Gordonia rhizosphera]|uniref:Uncharacterized protein n=1 Tax=Gordonia rhizosphera NBRC 16068 TaxID=1108045 RepID=K6WCE2_9ACTN|nr:DUF6084 family protein [Gordonia rhizosphera]GAB91396.1 hypothetical protein GORHZ_130_00190 [Gordonia rhizosphera NBRC 16068]
MTDTAAPGFEVIGVRPEPYCVSPTLVAQTRITMPDDTGARAIALRAQVRIEPARRDYGDAEADGLVDIFGSRDRWADTQRTFLWMHASTMVPGFRGHRDVDLPLPCTYDFEVTASRYLHALRGGTVPVVFLFSGTVFAEGPTGFSVQQIPWDRESRYDLPVAVWRDLMATSFPGAGWLRLREDTLAALSDYKSAHGLLGYDDAVSALLHGAEVTR